MAEWLKAPVLKTGMPVRASQVRILSPPPQFLRAPLAGVMGIPSPANLARVERSRPSFKNVVASGPSLAFRGANLSEVTALRVIRVDWYQPEGG